MPPSLPPPDDAGLGPARRWLWLGAGWLFVALGVAGVVLPVLPTTPFLLLALWAFSRSSVRFHDWLYHHPRLGPPLQRWRRERVVPLKVKLLAAASMLASLAWVSLAGRVHWSAVAATAVAVAAGLAFLARVPSRPAPEPPPPADPP